MIHNSSYSLEKHQNGKSKHICPACGKRTFVRYINIVTKQYLNDNVGRCDRQDSCTYHYPPKEYHRDNPSNDKYNNYNYDNTHSSTRTAVPCTTDTNGTNLVRDCDYIPFEYIEKAAKTRSSNLIEYFLSLFDWNTICDTVDKYFIGCTKDKAVVYPQIDANGRVRTAKIQQYNSDTGRRVKDQPNAIGWVHSRMIKKGVLSEGFKLRMCLFGEHLIRSEKYKNMSVGIVESEKTALIASACMPKLLWMAAGALEWLNIGKLEAIKDRKIILYPDTSIDGRALDKWTKIADRAKGLGYNISVSTLLEKTCTDEEKASGYDLGDYLIDRLRNVVQSEVLEVEQATEPIIQSTVLSDMIRVNPILADLIDKFDLVEE